MQRFNLSGSLDQQREPLLITPHSTGADPGQRREHTIIPFLTTNPDGSLHCVHGVMDSFMQSQGQVQALSTMADDKSNAQGGLAPASARTQKTILP
jgi:gamma-glutamyltranspeptidase